MSRPDSVVSVALLFPDLLGTYGDSGNAVILVRRLVWRGIPAELVTVRSGEAVPVGCQLYVVGGGEDLPQSRAASELGASDPGSAPLRHAADRGAVVLAVCAGLQILGTSFVGPDGRDTPGIGLFDVRTTRGRGRRAVGEVLVEPDPALGVPLLTGYENHAGVTTLGSAARPVGRVLVGRGNGDGSRADGAWAARRFGTYLHGPLLARNPSLADLLLSWVVGPVEPLDDREARQLHSERVGAARSGRLRFSARR